jgi:hypothetical protein
VAIGGTTEGELVADLPSAFQGLDTAVSQFFSSDLRRFESPVFAMNFSEPSPETLLAMATLEPAARAPTPISPVFFGLADRKPTTLARPNPDTVDRIFVGLGDGTDDARW